MATKKKSSPKSKRSTGIPAALKVSPPPANPKVLDLTGEPVHPVVRLPEGDFEMLTQEELTFEQFGRQVHIGNRLVERAAHVEEDGVLEELQELVMEAARMILIDLTDEAAANLTPGRYLKISNFFNTLAAEDGQSESEPGLSSAPDASGSTERQAAN